MAEFINTVDVVGDDALTDSIIDKSITEYNNDSITTLGDYAFYGCTALTSVNCPDVTRIGGSAFYGCSNLARADFLAVTSVHSRAFYNCTNLIAIIIRNTAQVCPLNYTDALSNTPITAGTGYIYVPSALVDSYKAATNWSTYASQFRAIEDYPYICGG